MKASGIVLVAVLAAATGAALPYLAFPSYGTALPLAVIASACVLVGGASLYYERDPLSPLFLFALVFLTFYVLRPLYVLSHGTMGPTRIIDDQPITPDVKRAMAEALWIAALGIVSFVVGYVVTARRRRSTPATTQIRVATIEHAPTVLLVLLTGGIAFVVYAVLIRDAGGLHAYIDQLSVRSAFFYGRAYLTAATIPFKVTSLALIAVMLQRRSTRPEIVIGFALLLAVSVGDFLTGGRAAFILGTAVPVALLAHRLRRPLRVRILIPLAIGLAIFAITSRVITRDSVYLPHPGQSRGTLIVDALSNIPRSIVGGRDFVALDSLTSLVEARQTGRAPLQWGATYADTLAFPMPRALWHGKPAGGGNAWFTSHLYPDFYGTGHVETSVSLVGEAYLNFGLAGVAFVLFIAGSLGALLLTQLARVRSISGALVCAVSLGFLLQWSRGDTYHALTSWAMTVALIKVIAPLCVREGEARVEFGPQVMSGRVAAEAGLP